MECKCDMRTKMVGDGCAICNPEKAIDYTGCGNCHTCLSGVYDSHGFPVTTTRMIVCPECGNKRCPKASDHRLKCTRSNMPGQKGSICT